MGRTHPTLKLTTMLRHLILLLAFQCGFDKAYGRKVRQAEPSLDRADDSCPTQYDYNTLNWGSLLKADNTACFPTCGSGTDQAAGSPIDIVPSIAVPGSHQLNHFEELKFINQYKALSGSWEQKTFTFQFTKADKVDGKTQYGPMVQYNSQFTNSANNYELLQVHYHWGVNSGEGSEHTIDGKEYPLEAHFVHGNTKYRNTDGGYTDPDNKDGLLVIGVFYEISTTESWVSDEAGKAETYATNGNVKIDSSDMINMYNTLKAALEGGHYSYKGSLTTPACNEVVTWIVAKTPLTVKKEDLDKFRQLNKPSPFTGKVERNWRPTQGDAAVAAGTRVVFEMSKSWDYGSWAWYYGIMS